MFLTRIKEVIELLQEIDVNVVVGSVARERNFCFAEAADDGEILVAMKGLHHPRIDGAISNDLEVTATKNVFFLTGANMAGKSTLMKSFGIAVYLLTWLPRGGNFHAVPYSRWNVHVY